MELAENQQVCSLLPPSKKRVGLCVEKKPNHIRKIADTLFEDDVWENISDVNRAIPMIHAQKRTSLSKAVFLGISFYITATVPF